MNVICVICSELLLQSGDVFYTRCGHVFHLECLTQWIERSKTCPQCREKVTQSRIHRLYFTFSSNETVIEPNASSLQERIDSLKFQILLKEKDIKYYTSKTVTLEKQNVGLRKEVRKVESEINQKNSAIYALKEQTKYFKEQSAECDNLKREIERLKSKIEELKPVQILLHSPIQDVVSMVGKTRDPTTLMTYISVLKKELIAAVNKCKQLRITIKKLQENFTNEESKRMKLAEKLAFSESRAMSLDTRVKELEGILGISEASNSFIEIQGAENDESDLIESTVEELSNIEEKKKENSRKSFKSNTSRKDKTSLKRAKNTEEEMSDSQIEINESSNSENSFLTSTSTTDSSITEKRPRMSTGWKDSDISDLNRSTGNNYVDHEIHHSKLKRKRGSITNIKKEKYENKNKSRSDGSLIDLT